MADLNDKSNTNKDSKQMQRVRVWVQLLNVAVSAGDNFQFLFRDVKFHDSDYHFVKI